MTDAVSRVRAAAAERRFRFRAGALIALAVVIALILWLALRDTGGSSSSQEATTPATAATAAQIKGLAESVGHPVFWLGPKRAFTYELTRAPNGSIYIRYLPRGVKVGVSKPYLTVATYPFPGAYGAIRAVEKQNGSTAVRVRGGGLGVMSSSYPESVHLAYPGVDYQVEVFDPTPGVATALVAGGKLVAIGTLRQPATPKPQAVSAAGLRALAKGVGHAVYWAGRKAGYTYEVTQRTGGQVYVRYLPPGVRAGTSQPYVTIASYPFPGAFRAMQALAKQNASSALKVPDGGVAIVDARQPTSIHLAFPNSDVQVEVFDPSATDGRKLVSSGKIKTVG